MIRTFRDPRALPQRDLKPLHGSHYLMGLEHREIIATSIPQGGRMLEWGCGNSTVWFRANVPDATIVSVEHDPERAERFGAVHRAVNAGKPATIGEEWFSAESDPSGYVFASDFIPAKPEYDVILVDGVLRNLCLLAAHLWLTPTGVVFLHDSDRNWYTTGQQAYRGVMESGSCHDYPGPKLWAGYPRRR